MFASCVLKVVQAHSVQKVHILKQVVSDDESQNVTSALTQVLGRNSIALLVHKIATRQLVALQTCTSRQIENMSTDL